MYIIYTERILGTGSTHREQYKCKSYSRSSDGIIEFWNLKEDEHYLVSIHKMDSIMIQEIDDDKNIKESEVKCIT